MASYLTYLGDKQILIEAPVASAFAKSDAEIQPDPKRAIVSVMETIKSIVDYAGENLGPSMRRSGASCELAFAVRADSSGQVMISEGAQIGQFQVSVKWPPVRPAAPPPRTAPPALPQREQD